MFSLSIVTALLGTVLAAPASDSQPSSKAPPQHGLRVSEAHTGIRIARSGPARYAHSLSKWTDQVPPHVMDAAAKDVQAQQSGQVDAENINYDEEYLCPVAIGTPPQIVYLDFEFVLRFIWHMEKKLTKRSTGSSDLWVFTNMLPPSAFLGHQLVDMSQSSTAQLQQGENWKIGYGDSSGASGIVYADKVVVGHVTATSMAVEAATSISTGFTSDTQNSGLLGLALSSLNTITLNGNPDPQRTFFDTVASTLPSPLFTVALKHNAPGIYTFGYLNHSDYKGDMVYAPLNPSNGFWEFNAAGWTVDGEKQGDTLDCVADTGTSLVLLPDSVLATYYSKVPAAHSSLDYGGWVFPCDAQLPDFGITVGQKTFQVPGAYVNYAQVSQSECYGGMQSSKGVGFNILGDVFLKSLLVVFDQGGQRIGFALQK